MKFLHSAARWPQVGLYWSQTGWMWALGISAFIVPLSSNGAWILLAPVAILLCYLAGRRLESQANGAWALIVGTVFGGLTLLLNAHLSLLSFALNLVTASVLFVVLPWLLGRARRNAVLFRQQEREHLVIQAGLRERSRIAGQMHDQLGHDLALLALQASALQVSLPPESSAREQAAKLREQSDTAIENLHRIIGVLRDPDSADTLDPTLSGEALPSVEVIIGQAQSHGMQVSVHGEFPADRYGELFARVIREALTNAAKYAPGEPVEVHFQSQTRSLTLRISNPLPNTPPVPRSGASGLKFLAELVQAHGGHFQAGAQQAEFQVLVDLPRLPTGTATQPVGRLHTPQKPGRRWVALAIPAGIVALLCAGLYLLQVATYQATGLDPTTYQQLHPGMPRAEVNGLIGHQGLDQALPILHEAAPPPGSSCRYFAARSSPLDLNSEMFRLCFLNDTLVSLDHLHP